MFLRVNGRRYRVPLGSISVRLARASEQQREMVRVSPSGHSMKWPLIDLEMQTQSVLQLGQPCWSLF